MLKGWVQREFLRQNLAYARLQFLANFAVIQMTTLEYLDLSPASKRTGDVRVTSSGMRPVLTFKYWPVGAEYGPTLPTVQIIVEERRLLVKDSAQPDRDWVLANNSHPYVKELDSFFLSFRFHHAMRAEHKKKRETDAKAQAAE